jgi:hypothetical protein
MEILAEKRKTEYPYSVKDRKTKRPSNHKFMQKRMIPKWTKYQRYFNVVYTYV